MKTYSSVRNALPVAFAGCCSKCPINRIACYRKVSRKANVRSPFQHPQQTSSALTAISDAMGDTSLADASFIETTALAPPPGITPIREFEPVMNVPATSSFLVIVIVFALLQFRINAVATAAKRRTEALEVLRKVESLQLSASDVGIDPSERPTEKDVILAKKEYENALMEEMNLRSIIPGVRIVAPNDPKRQEEERAAAKRFLGLDLEEIDGRNGSEIETSKGNGVGQNNLQSGYDDEEAEKMASGPRLLLLGVASMLIVSLWTLSLDPMTANNVFVNIGGDPPSDLRFSSW